MTDIINLTILILLAVTIFATAILMVTTPVQRRFVDTAYTIREFLFFLVLLDSVLAHIFSGLPITVFTNVARLALLLSALSCLFGIIYIARRHGIEFWFRSRKNPAHPRQLGVIANESSYLRTILKHEGKRIIRAPRPGDGSAGPDVRD